MFSMLLIPAMHDTYPIHLILLHFFTLESNISLKNYKASHSAFFSILLLLHLSYTPNNLISKLSSRRPLIITDA